MTDDRLIQQYKELVSTYIEKGDERSLYEVSGFARACLAQDLGPEILVEMHSSILSELVKGRDTEVQELVAKSNQVLLEAMMTYGLIYQELLERKNVERKTLEQGLQERVKELQCLYGIAGIAERPGITLDEIYQETANLLPGSWQYPGITYGRVTIDGREFKTENYTESRWKQSSDIKIGGTKAGSIEVGYLRERPEIDEGPFFKEERLLIDAVAERLGRIAERKQAEEKVEHLNLVLRAIRTVNQLIVRERDRDRLLKDVCNNLVETRGYNSTCICLFDESGMLVAHAETGLGKDFLPMVERLQRGELTDCIKRALIQSGVVITKASSLTCGDCPLVKVCSGEKVVTMRMEHGEKVYGLLRVSLSGDASVSGEEQSLLREVTGDIAFALHSMELEEERRQSFEKLQKALRETVHALASAVEMRDPYTAGHQRRVTELARALAEEMGLSEEQIEGLHMAGLVHDIGKINVPAEILSKPGQLNDVEFSMIKAHSQAGYDILRTIEFPWPVAKIVLQHHERLDGSGYPQGLKGEEILLEARILSVADVVEAMSSYRPYRPALGIEKALEEISNNKGVKYDSEVVDACLELFAEGRFKFQRQ